MFFLAYEKARVNVPAQLVPPNSRCYSFVRTGLFVPWFVVSVDVHDANDPRVETLLVSDPSVLEGMLLTGERVKCRTIQVLTVNKPGLPWTCEQIEEVLVDRRSGRDVLYFKKQGGGFYDLGFERLADKSALDGFGGWKRIFKAPT